jgi:dTDP-4-amino-4,6-dideoxygalactose transaminase
LSGHVGLPEFEKERHAAQSFVVLLPTETNRANLMRDLLKMGVETGTGTIAIPLTDVYREKYDLRPRDFPNLCSVAGRALSLPLHGNMSVQDAEFVSSALLTCLSL